MAKGKRMWIPKDLVNKVTKMKKKKKNGFEKYFDL